jgi:hypothetical protein
MSLRLPAYPSPLRDLFDIEMLAEVAAPDQRHLLPTLDECRTRADRFIKESPDVNYLTWVARQPAPAGGEELVLVQTKADLTAEVLWHFER